MIQLEINITIDEKDNNKMTLSFNKLFREDANPLEKKYARAMEKFYIAVTKDILIASGADKVFEKQIKNYQKFRRTPHE